MNILFISRDLIAGNLALILKKEGHNVRLFIEKKQQKANFENMVDKVSKWKDHLNWVGKQSGLIVFDDVGYGATQDKLRKEGYFVAGGCKIGDKLELDREFAHKIFSEHGLNTVPLFNFKGLDPAIKFVKENPNAWVIKQNESAPKSLNFVPSFEDGRDTIDILESYKKNIGRKIKTITLQKKVTGVEIAVGRFFNGNEWIGPVLMNVEHKKFFPGDLGPTTSEMGTLAWFDKDENNKIYSETLEKLTGYLSSINYKGYFDINCIVNSDGIFPLEATARFGSPIVHLQSELHISPWGEILYAVATGKNYELKVKGGYGIVVLLTLPPFPYTTKLNSCSSFGIKIYEREKLTSDEWEHIHFEEISSRSALNKDYYISDNRGYIIYVTGTGLSPNEAHHNTYRLISKICIPKMIYRNDIGLRFANKDQKKLASWGYIK